ncbi:hypothetical protein COUCH_26330 [Couchioplanes caeruleus]|uniref:hypothetical protein n=1 Tax=Couchioplanes caeruleus TaxID=56438 RepID=UPI0020BE6CF8|nr:hypothetical protein [Couchioplanes caeruleus]UQU62535.1 hypothetical protein COUCH_26330 [Couchioplanes caeruleus]
MYLIVFDGEQAGWRLERDVLLAALRRDWPQIAVTEIGEEVRDISWPLPGSDGLSEAYVHSDGTCLYVDGPIDQAAQWAVWYRRLVPDGIDLMLCDDEYSFAVPVGPQTSASELVTAGS